MGLGAIYVDDSGNPGQDSGSEFLSPSRKSWTAVIVPAAVDADVSTAMDIFLGGVQSDFGARELHFTDIFSGKGVWKGVPLGRRIEIFDLMSTLMGNFGLPVIHVTTSNETLQDHPEIVAGLKPTDVGSWNLADIAHFGFLRLCSTAAQYLREFCQDAPQDFRFPMPLYVDEGLKKSGAETPLPNWGDVISGPKALFCSSSDIPGIQLADFAAFSLTRSQWIAAKHEAGQPMTDAQREFLKTTSRLNVLNMAFFQVPEHKFGKDLLEKNLSADRLEKGLSARPAQKH